MRTLLLTLNAAALAVGLGACSYAPPAQTNTASPKYQADLDSCETSVPDGVDKRNAKRGLTWMAGGVTRWSRIDDGLNACMGGKGWGHLRACTADELRQGSKTQATGTLTVTRDGIRCTDPNKPG